MAIMKVAKTGGSVTGAESDLVFSSQRPCMIELITGTKSVSTNDYITHSLGYVPMYTVFMKIPDPYFSGLPNNCWSPCIGFIGNGWEGGIVTADTDKLYFKTFDAYNETTEEWEPITTDFYYSIFSNTVTNATGSGKNNVSGKIRVAKAGYDARTETDARNMIFFSGKNVLKIDTVKSGSVQVTLPEGDIVDIFSVYHGLGYVPLVFATEDFNGSRIPYSNPNGDIFSYYIDSNYVYFACGNAFAEGGEREYTIKYIITRDKIA